MALLTPAGTPLGYESISGLSVVKTLTVPGGAARAVLVAASQGVAYRDDGTAPTAVAGYPVATGVHFEIRGPAALAAAQFIELAASAVLHVLYYKD